MRLSVTTNADQVLREIDDYVARLKRAATRAVNELAETAKVAGLREISNRYGIGPRAFEKYVTVRLARGEETGAEIVVRGRGLPLFLFQARQTKRGVSVKLKGRRFVIPHAFIKQMTSGHVGVFARGAYGGKEVLRKSGDRFGRFVFGYSRRRRSDRSRFSINELFTFAPPDAFANESVTMAMVDRVEEQLGRVVKRAIAFEVRR